MHAMKFVKKVIKCAVPFGAVQVLKHVRKDYKFSSTYMRLCDYEAFAVLDKNKVFSDIHKNERCFILGTGPSINKINIDRLKNEKCIFLSQFYLHKNYISINPIYHLFSGIATHTHIPQAKVLELFNQMEQRIPVSTTLFMNYLDRMFILQNNFFAKHNVHYLYFKKSLDGLFAGKINAARALYEAGGIPVMAVQLAVYMGFKEIYLLGVDCTWDSGTSNNHCYDPEESVVDCLGYSREYIMANLSYIEREYRQFISFLDQLRALNDFAKRVDCKIYNAAPGGKLEVFERVDFNSLF